MPKSKSQNKKGSRSESWNSLIWNKPRAVLNSLTSTSGQRTYDRYPNGPVSVLTRMCRSCSAECATPHSRTLSACFGDVEIKQPVDRVVRVAGRPFDRKVHATGSADGPAIMQLSDGRVVLSDMDLARLFLSYTLPPSRWWPTPSPVPVKKPTP